MQIVDPTAFIVGYNPTIVTKLQSVCIRTELVYIGRRRTTSFNIYKYKFIHHEGSTLGYIRYMVKYKTDNYKEDRQSR